MATQSQTNLIRHRQLAPTASVRVSPLCLGAMTFGDAMSDRYGVCTKESSLEILDYFYSQGGNFIDTANTYRAEESEIWLGEWMANRQNRDELVLATKFTSAYQTHHKGKIQSNFGGNGTKSMKVSLERSLQKLQTTYIDLFYLHWWDYTVTIPELMHALNDLVVAGKVFYLGISDAPAWVVAKANQYARDHGLRQFSVYQGMWNAGMRDFERDILPMCRDEGMAMCPYGTLGQGRFRTDAGYKEREQSTDGRNLVPLSEHDKVVSKVLEKIANKKGCKLLDVALGYIISKAPYVFPIVGGRKVEHIKESAEALAVSLTDDEIREVESAYRFDPGFPHTFLSGTLITGSDPKGAYLPQDMFLTKLMGTFDWVEEPRPIKLNDRPESSRLDWPPPINGNQTSESGSRK